MLLRDRFTATIAALAVGALPLGGASAMPTSAALLADAQGSASNVAMATAPDFAPPGDRRVERTPPGSRGQSE